MRKNILLIQTGKGKDIFLALDSLIDHEKFTIEQIGDIALPESLKHMLSLLSEEKSHSFVFSLLNLYVNSKYFFNKIHKELLPSVEKISLDAQKYFPDTLIACDPFASILAQEIGGKLGISSVSFVPYIHKFYIYAQTDAYIVSSKEEYIKIGKKVKKEVYEGSYVIEKKYFESFQGEIKDIYAKYMLQQQQTVLISLEEDGFLDETLQRYIPQLPASTNFLFLFPSDKSIPKNLSIAVEHMPHIHLLSEYDIYELLVIADVHICKLSFTSLLRTFTSDTLLYIYDYDLDIRFLIKELKKQGICKQGKIHELMKVINLSSEEKKLTQKKMQTFLEQMQVYAEEEIWNSLLEKVCFKEEVHQAEDIVVTENAEGKYILESEKTT